MRDKYRYYLKCLILLNLTCVIVKQNLYKIFNYNVQDFIVEGITFQEVFY